MPNTREIADGVRGTASVRQSNVPDLQGLLVSPELGYRLAALCDGEGHFGIQKAHTAYKCLFVIGLRADDAPFLHRMRDEIGLGTVSEFPAYKAMGGRKNSPAAQWRVSAKAECLELVRILDVYPLWSKKARDYAIWREAVIYWQDITHRGRLRRDWSAIGPLWTELRELRKAA